ncbi:IS21 family transposase [Maribellus comscasis]|uniref:IS21 family transposase n=1 Tax=Maribellus comscasis TaxID=2681766 RepID=A0A6I6K3C0_9BACT|nr:IS21 family transposase [Maribellus comscasis]QGY44721.1 IS21 family transposase [Maribellus comscasis]QGY47850.1 IS21 family transposase [Maribellus comscasis]QGY47880.1 IS21 family transposase [Maribellus comscasis]
MANKLDPMDLKQILSLHNEGLSNRQIGDLLSISRNTVNNYIKLAKSSDYSIREMLTMDPHQLGELFTAHTTLITNRYDELMAWFDKVNQQRNHPGFTFMYHYQEYQGQVSNPYSYTQFMEHYHRKYDQVKGSMKLEHEAGREMYIDFAGKKLHIINKETGELIPVEVFVALLPNSQYAYVTACLSQKREDLISCTARALSFFGGVPKAIVSDNLKSAVTRASKYEPEINRTFKDFARHYGCVINPTRSYAPQDKALVENAVNLAYQRIYYPLRDMDFFSLEDLNREIRKLLKGYNNLLFQRKQASRRELFQSVERAYLKPLPDTAYQLKDYRRAKVQKIGYVYFSTEKSYYSVPYRYIGKSTLIHYTASTVEVYYNHQRIALHKRNYTRGSYNTIKEHLSSTHKAYSEWNPDFFRRIASKHGPNVLAVIDQLVSNCDYPEPVYKRAMGIIQLHRSYGSLRLDNACKRALLVETYSLRRISNILKNNMDTLPFPEENTNVPHIPAHNNLRGAAAYK